jgi:hypothetical protein
MRVLPQSLGGPRRPGDNGALQGCLSISNPSGPSYHNAVNHQCHELTHRFRLYACHYQGHTGHWRSQRCSAYLPRALGAAVAATCPCAWASVRVLLQGMDDSGITQGPTADRIQGSQRQIWCAYLDPLFEPDLTTITGSLARVGPNELITDDPEVLRKMMAARSEYTRGHCKGTLSRSLKHFLKAM